MRNIKYTVLSLAVLLAACSNPKDLVLGPEPLKDITEHSSEIRKIPEDERMLLLDYVGAMEIASAFGDKSPTLKLSGKTVGEVIEEAKVWKTKRQEMEKKEAQKRLEEEKLKQKQKEEEEALLKKIEEANGVASFKISQAVTISVIKRTVRPAGPYELHDFMLFEYAVENKSDVAIKLIKGRLDCIDLLGEKIGDLGVTFDETIKPKSIVKTTTGSGWRVGGIRGEIEEIAGHSWESMKCSFKIKAIAFEDGTALSLEDLPNKN